ncbi:Protein of unknown function [Gryllus bimaculatus]|nr:Protein of unknown function [Gryllus bimaculatus]
MTAVAARRPGAGGGGGGGGARPEPMRSPHVRERSRIGPGAITHVTAAARTAAGAPAARRSSGRQRARGRVRREGARAGYAPRVTRRRLCAPYVRNARAAIRPGVFWVHSLESKLPVKNFLTTSVWCVNKLHGDKHWFNQRIELHCTNSRIITF